ncbi:MAG TPA: DUF3592 domain-containing protein [Opitutaceae bacterium]|nr:DUF3592 domain-containing protein [Opitutaceae bacterium]
MSLANSSPAHDEQLVAVLMTPPPRQLPREVRGLAHSQAAPLSFGIFGAVFGGLGLMFVAIFFPRKFAQDWQLRQPDAVHANGVIVAVADTKLRLNQTNVARYLFEFRTTAGTLRRGECFTTGRRWRAGELVQVLYRPEAPSIACPSGARLSLSSNATMFVVIFPLVGAGMVIWVAISRWRTANIFRHGEVLQAFVTDIEHTQTMVDDYGLFKITLQRVDAPRAPSIHVRHWKPKVVAFLQKRMDAKQPVFVLIDPRKTGNYFLPETL